MNITLSGVTIRSIAAAVPKDEVDLTELYGIYGTDDVDRIMALNGISHVRLAPEELCTSDLCEAASRALLNEENLETVDGIVFVSQTPDYILPATSALLQHRLGLSQDTVIFDLNSGCPGYVYGLYQASLLVASGSCQNVLVCVGDVITRYVNPLDRSSRMVFGDGGSASVVSKGTGNIAFGFRTDGSGGEHLIIPAGGCRYPLNEDSGMVEVKTDGNMRSDEDIYMNGLDVMNYAVREVPQITENLLQKMGWKSSEIGLFGFHQANRFMLDNLRKIMKLPKESVPITMGKLGNTGSASIPLMLSQEHRRLANENRLQKTVLCGFGVGLSCAAAALDLSQTKILDFIEV
ncbi:MAG: ketoacyl-ACP synthase III [SAR324 cluster bacterium]|nr:ketoacyl-ACP synthase III [SAR324 cluster bacterium]